MDENKNVNDKNRTEYHSFYDVMRRVMLAGIGAIALKHDELEEIIGNTPSLHISNVAQQHSQQLQILVSSFLIFSWG